MVRRQEGTLSNMALALKEAIEADGRSLNQLAKASGIDAGRLSRFVRGERDINLDAAGRLCDVLGVKFVMPQKRRRSRPRSGGRRARRRNERARLILRMRR